MSGNSRSGRKLENGYSQIRRRFFAKIEVVNDCWRWKGAMRGHYGVMVIDSVFKRAAHIAWFLEYGCWPVQLNHLCELKRCANPSHVYEGSVWENEMDKRFT